MRGKHHRSAGRLRLADEIEDDRPGRWIEVGRRFVEDHEGRLGGEDDGQGEFLPHARAHPRDLTRTVEIEAPGNVRGRVTATFAAQSGEEIEDRMARHPAEEAGLPREIGSRSPDSERVESAVVPRHAGLPGGGMNEAEKKAEEGRLPRAIGAEEAEHLPLTDGQRAALERRERAIPLRELIRFDEH